MKKLLFIFSVLAVIVLMMPNQSQAQYNHQTARNIGLGGGGVAYLDAYNANFINPANLMLYKGKRPKGTLGLVSISASGFNSALNIGDYNDYFTNGDVVGVDVTADIFGTYSEQHSLDAQADIVVFGFSKRNTKSAYSVAIRSRAFLNGEFNRGTAEVFLEGLNEEIFNDPKAVNFNYDLTTVSELSIGYAREVKSFTYKSYPVRVFAGIAPKLLFSNNATSMDMSSTLQLNAGANGESLVHTYNYSLFSPAEAFNDKIRQYINDRNNGLDVDIDDYTDEDLIDASNDNWSYGLGFDLGVTAEIDFNRGTNDYKPHLMRVGLSITDIGKVTLDGGSTFGANSVFEFDGFDYDEIKDGDDYLDTFADSLLQDVYAFDDNNITSKDIELPTNLNLGVAYQYHDVLLSLDLSKGFKHVGASDGKVAMAVGAEYKLLGFLPLRVGYRTSSSYGNTISSGIGIEAKYLELQFGFTAPLSMNRGYRAAFGGLVFRF